MIYLCASWKCIANALWLRMDCGPSWWCYTSIFFAISIACDCPTLPGSSQPYRWVATSVVDKYELLQVIVPYISFYLWGSGRNSNTLHLYSHRTVTSLLAVTLLTPQPPRVISPSSPWSSVSSSPSKALPLSLSISLSMTSHPPSSLLSLILSGFPLFLTDLSQLGSIHCLDRPQLTPIRVYVLQDIVLIPFLSQKM